jgi:hypothetical protein
VNTTDTALAITYLKDAQELLEKVQMLEVFSGDGERRAALRRVRDGARALRAFLLGRLEVVAPESIPPQSYRSSARPMSRTPKAALRVHQRVSPGVPVRESSKRSKRKARP